MNAKVIFVAGVPASGKTTLFKELREKYFADSSEFKEGKARGITSADGKYHMLGVFDGSLFEGTDKLSMTVIDDAIKFCNSRQQRCVIFVEGDRLFNYRFLSETGARLILIDADEEILRLRHIVRGDNQTERFLRSRRTKIENFALKYNVQRFMNNTIHDNKRLFEAVCNMAEEWNMKT